MDTALIIVIAVIALAVIGGFLVLFKTLQTSQQTQQQLQVEETARLAQMAAQLSNAQQQLVGQLNQMANANTAQQAELTRTLNDRLDAVSKRLGESLSQQTEKTGKTISDLHTRLAVIDKAQANITELSSKVVGLQDILANKQARGAFGEVQLNDLVSAALPPSAYSFQATLSNGKRADCLIKLPNPPGPIVVDAKFPLESYHLLRDAKTDPEQVQTNRAFTTALTKHIDDISSRYILPGETAESALMFLPSEAIYAELHTNFPAVVDRSYRARVWIVSPTTLMATLNTVRAVLRDARMREQAGVIQKEVVTMMQDVDRLKDRVDKLRGHFGQANKDIELIETSAAKIVRRGEKIEELQLEAPEEGAAGLTAPAEHLPAD